MKQPPFLHCVTRSHPYWGQKQSNELHRIFKDMQPGDVLLDLFCREAAPVVTALQRGSKVLAGDINPVAVFLIKVLAQPVGLYSLKKAFEEIQQKVSGNIQNRYTGICPGCKKPVNYEYLKWVKEGRKERPESVRITCQYCGFNQLKRLSKFQIQRQLSESKAPPEYWYPEKKITLSKKKDALFIQDFFTSRNLASLAELLNAIHKISSVRCREVLQYVFTGILTNCITIQNTTAKSGAASRWWKTSDRFSPSPGQEINVWKAFEKQFAAVLTCKKELNSLLGFTGFANSMDEFENTNDQAYIHLTDLRSEPFPRKLKITHVLIDPLYNRDNHYSILSAFWGAWLKMNCTDLLKWHSEALPEKDDIQKLKPFLSRIRKHSGHSCKIILAHRTKNTEYGETLHHTFLKMGYKTETAGSNFPDIAEKSNKQKVRVSDHYYSLTWKSQTEKEILKKSGKNDYREVELFVQMAAFHERSDQPEKVKCHAGNLIKPSLQNLLAERSVQEIRETISDKRINRRAYNRICLSLLRAILLKDNYKIKSVAEGSFHDATLDIHTETADFKIHDSSLGHIDFIAENKNGRKIFFCFYSPEKEKALKQAAEDIFQKDRHEFQIICYLIFPHKSVMKSYRHISQADKWPRGFYVCFEDICKKAAEVDPDQFGHLFNMEPMKTDLGKNTKHRIKHFKAEVIQNTPVGLDGKPMHFKLQFTAPDMHTIGPGQFVMIDTLPEGHRKKRNRSPEKRISEYRKHAMDLSARSFLKRPFGIQRAYYKHFEWGYHNKLHLPAQLAAITNTVYPHQFEIFYKIIEDGIGTNELKNLNPGNQIKILGPLGKFINIPKWRSDNVDEVHLIGGGVGMAPLVFFGQALKFYSFKLKAFIGIDRIESLREAPYGKTFSDESEKAYVYINELSKIGLNPDEIFLSRESTENEILSDKINHKNYHVGLVVDHYSLFLNRLKQTESILILACGPKPMLIALKNIATKFNIPMKVLLEKRMGCGIGVCMSCVCRTRKGSKGSRYSRVCVDGPLFDSKEIDWEQL